MPRNHPWKKQFPKVPRLSYLSIRTCPICTQNKSIEEFSQRELYHTKRHLYRTIGIIEQRIQLISLQEAVKELGGDFCGNCL